jgi:hypothetical protein
VGQDRVSYSDLRRHQAVSTQAYGYSGLSFTLTDGTASLPFTVVDTLARIDLPQPLAPGDSDQLRRGLGFNIVRGTRYAAAAAGNSSRRAIRRSFFLAQWYPRMAAYSDYDGWHNKAFLGRGEFTLEFGDYRCRDDRAGQPHRLRDRRADNPGQVLSAEQRRRLAASRSRTAPVFVVTPEEALANEKTAATGTKTWRFKAENVRDFAWASSNKFIWDAMVHEQPGARHDRVLAMSFYPNEAEPIWSKYSTHAVVHTMDVYSRFSFDYPYPTAQSVNTWEGGGMEYPMITFNGYRPDPPRAKRTTKRTR